MSPRVSTEVRELISVEWKYSDDPDDGDSIEAYIFNEHGDFPTWHVGGRCTANYVSIIPDEIDAWITILTEMKKRSPQEEGEK